MAWRVKHFKTLEQFNAWTERNAHRIQWTRIWVNNREYSIEYRRLRVIG